LPDPDPDSRLRVAVVDAFGRPVRAGALANWLRRAAPRSAGGEVTIALVSDRRIRTLNRRYRRKDAVTDVLSFPTSAPSLRLPEARSLKPDAFLGDIVIARGRAGAQAREARHSVQVELRILALHGLLHLLGYDHERDHGEMRRLEARLLRKSGLKSGLIERNR
jgi:probable rRNA maturation factor